MRNFTVLPVLLVLFTGSILSQPITWQKSFRSDLTNDHQAFSVCPAEGTNIYVSGLTSDPRQGYVFKLTQYGDTLWKKYVPVDYITCSAGLPDGGCMLGAYDGVIFRVSQNGVRTDSCITNMVILDIKKVRDSIYMFCGGIQDKAAIGEIDSHCRLIWLKVINNRRVTYVNEISKDSLNNLVMCGMLRDSTTGYVKGMLIKVDTSGNVFWTKYYSVFRNTFFENILTFGDCYISTGYADSSTSNSHYKVFLIKTNTSGDSVASKLFPSQRSTFFTSFLKSAPAQFYYAYSKDTLAYQITVLNRMDKNLSVLKKIELWPKNDYVNVHKMIFAPNSQFGEIVLAGDVDTFSQAQVQFYVARIDSSLNVLPPPIGVHQVSNEIPAKFSLDQNYPNPFNPVTKIKFDLPKSSHVRIVIYDIAGKEVLVVSDKELTAGKYESEIDGSSLASGIYFCRIEAEEFTSSIKIVLVK